MLLEKKQSYLGKLMLLCATIIWGSSFFILKNTVDDFPTYYVLAIRFSIAVVLMAVIFIKKVITLNKTTVVKGIILGIFLAIAYGLQTFGLKSSTPAKNAFLTATYCIIVPFLCWIIFRKKPNVYNVIAGIMCVTGIGCVSLNADFKLGIGEILTLGGSFFFALQLIAISRFGKSENLIQMLFVELLTSALIFWVLSLSTEIKSYPIYIGFMDLLPIMYLTIFATILAQMLQMFGQKVTTASEASLILCLEAFFGTLFSIIFYHEQMTARLYIGFSIIFVALIISETKLEFIKKGIDKIRIKIDNYKIKHNNIGG